MEGPRGGEGVLRLGGGAGMRPPVALLIYRPDLPQRGVFAPFAVFSPEWQALQYGIQQGVAVRLIDLPQAHQMALAPETEHAHAPQPPPAEIAQTANAPG